MLIVVPMNGRFYISDHVRVEETENGMSRVSCVLPSHLVADIVEMLDTILHLARWVHTRSRAAESVYLSKRFRALIGQGAKNVR